MMPDGERSSVLVQVCLECGREYYFELDQQPEALVCDRCGNTVFRSFTAERTPDDVQRDFTDSTARDLGTEDAGSDVSPDDLRDLNL